MVTNKYLNEIMHQTKRYAVDTSPTAAKEGFHRLIIRVPELRKLVTQGYSFQHLETAEIAPIWDHVWKNSQYYAVAHQVLYYDQNKTMSKFEFSIIKTWIDRYDCWEHSDDLSKFMHKSQKTIRRGYCHNFENGINLYRLGRDANQLLG